MENLPVVQGETEVALSPQEVVKQVGTIQQIMSTVMKKDTHYGVIPGCGDKPTLLKAGAEKISLTFRLAPHYEVQKIVSGEHREYEVVCTLKHIPSDKIIAQGVGNCSTMESKYRYRNTMENTFEPIPQDYKAKKTQYNKDGFYCRKINGAWAWVKMERVENPNLADQYNTVLKMAKKRAYVDATISGTACSDIFTQDLEDIRSNMAEPETAEAPAMSPMGKKTDAEKYPNSAKHNPQGKGNTATDTTAADDDSFAGLTDDDAPPY